MTPTSFGVPCVRARTAVAPERVSCQGRANGAGGTNWLDVVEQQQDLPLEQPPARRFRKPRTPPQRRPQRGVLLLEVVQNVVQCSDLGEHVLVRFDALGANDAANLLRLGSVH